MQKRGVSRLYVQNFLPPSTEKFRSGTLWCIRKFRVAKNFMPKNGISLNSVEKSFSHSADRTRRRTLLCFERALVSKNFKQRGGSFTVLSKNFLSHRTEKNSPGNPSVLQKISGREKYFMHKREVGTTIFRRCFCLTVPKDFNGEHFGVSEKLFYRNFSCIGVGGHPSFVEKICLTGPKRKVL